MVEIFKTTVDNQVQAFRLSEAVHCAFPGYQANFDLDDIDNILRVENTFGDVDVCGVISLIAGHGSFAELISDEIAAFSVNPYFPQT